jgi:hypothetical protein
MYSPTWSVSRRTDVVKLACRTTFVQNLDIEFHDPTDSLVADTGSRTDMASKQFFFPPSQRALQNQSVNALHRNVGCLEDYKNTCKYILCAEYII